MIPFPSVRSHSSDATQYKQSNLKGVMRSDLSKESAVELDDVWTVTTPHHHVKIHQQLLLLLLIHSRANPLRNTQNKDTYSHLLLRSTLKSNFFYLFLWSLLHFSSF